MSETSVANSVDWNVLDDADFRNQVRAFYEANYPEELRYLPRRLSWAESKPWYLALSKQGWIAPAWPVEHGGMGLSPAKQIIMLEEQERHGIGRGVEHEGHVIVRARGDRHRQENRGRPCGAAASRRPVPDPSVEVACVDRDRQAARRAALFVYHLP